jgi:hypothetical protein
MSRDYILRMIEQFGRFAAALRRLILGGKATREEVQAQLASISHQAGLDIELARVATVDTLMLSIAPGGDVDPSRCWMYAEVLYLDGLEAQSTDDLPRARADYTKARVLFTLVAPYGAFLVGFPEAKERILEIDQRLERLDDREGTDPGKRARRRRARRPAHAG